MTISYPLALPSSPGPSSMVLRMRDIVAVSVSPFTGSQQVYEHQGKMWALQFGWATLAGRDMAEPVLTFLTSLKGQRGTFLAGDPIGATPRGTATVVASATNFLKKSQALDHATWTKTRSSINADTTAAPDGTTTAEKIVEDNTSTNTHVVSQTFTKAASSLSYIFSVYVKASSRTKYYLWLHGSSSSDRVEAWYDISGVSTGNAAAQGSGFSLPVATITDAGSGWYRLTLSGTSNTDTSLGVVMGPATTMGASTYSGDGTSGIFVWGAQVELGTAETPYIPTDAAAVTRPAGPAARGVVNARASTIATQGWTANTVNILKAGDYLQVGSGEQTRLHKVLAAVDTDLYGRATFDIWPTIREPLADEAAIVKSNCKGTFRLANSLREVPIASPFHYSTTFDAIEAI